MKGERRRQNKRKEDDLRFMRAAISQSKAGALRGQMPFGAVVVDSNGRFTAKGHNEVRKKKDPTAHGEIVAIRKAWRRLGDWKKLKGSTIYSSCEPCLLCSFVITQLGFSRVVFAARGSDVPTYKSLLDSDFSKAAKWVNSQSDWNHIAVEGDCMRKEAKKILEAYPWTVG